MLTVPRDPTEARGHPAASARAARWAAVVLALTLSLVGAFAVASGSIEARGMSVDQAAGSGSIGPVTTTPADEHATTPTAEPWLRALMPSWGPVPSTAPVALGTSLAVALLLLAPSARLTTRQRRWRARLVGAPPGSVTSAIA